MELSEAALRKMFAELRPVGPSPPYADGDREQVEALLREAVDELKRSTRLVALPHRDHYGSGYASYVHVFCHKRGVKPAAGRPGDIEIPGIDLYLCRLAPLATFGAGSQSQFAGGKSFSQLTTEQLEKPPPGDWKWEINEIRTRLGRLGFDFPAAAELGAKLPFELKAKRYREWFSPATYFDAVFFWDE